MLSFGLPDRQLLEAGPPPKIQEALERLFSEKIAKTREACVSARAELNWPPRCVAKQAHIPPLDL